MVRWVAFSFVTEDHEIFFLFNFVKQVLFSVPVHVFMIIVQKKGH